MVEEGGNLAEDGDYMAEDCGSMAEGHGYNFCLQIQSYDEACWNKLFRQELRPILLQRRYDEAHRSRLLYLMLPPVHRFKCLS